jgi:hypothetical protein
LGVIYRRRAIGSFPKIRGEMSMKIKESHNRIKDFSVVVFDNQAITVKANKKMISKHRCNMELKIINKTPKTLGVKVKQVKVDSIDKQTGDDILTVEHFAIVKLNNLSNFDELTGLLLVFDFHDFLDKIFKYEFKITKDDFKYRNLSNTLDISLIDNHEVKIILLKENEYDYIYEIYNKTDHKLDIALQCMNIGNYRLNEMSDDIHTWDIVLSPKSMYTGVLSELKEDREIVAYLDNIGNSYNLSGIFRVADLEKYFNTRSKHSVNSYKFSVNINTN